MKQKAKIKWAEYKKMIKKNLCFEEKRNMREKKKKRKRREKEMLNKIRTENQIWKFINKERGRYNDEYRN